MSNKFQYPIFPERIYTITIGDERVEVLGQDIVNIVPEMLRKKYVQSFFGYEEVPFDKTQESLVE